MISPTSENTMSINKAVIVPFRIIRPLSLLPNCSTMDKYTGVSPIGLVRVKSVENARRKKVVNSFITFFPVHVYPLF